MGVSGSLRCGIVVAAWRTLLALIAFVKIRPINIDDAHV
jgi:hypothetical protein